MTLNPCATCGKPASQLCPRLIGFRVSIWCDTPCCEMVTRGSEAEAVAAWNERVAEAGR